MSAAARLRRLAVSFYAASPDCDIASFCAMLGGRGIGGVGLTARAVEQQDPAGLARLLARHDLRCVSLNSAGYVLHADAEAARLQGRLDDRLFACAAALGAPVNVIPGGLAHDPRLPLAEARRRAIDGLAALADRAVREGARIALEPIHPMAIGPRGCINQIALARDAIAGLPATGLTIDLFHSWWDADCDSALADRPRLFVAQICGVALPADGGPPRRTRMAAGAADLRRALHLLAAHDGLLEYEVFHAAMPPRPDAALLDEAVADYLTLTEAA